ncbi:hypothetical protein HanRHA438_Chr04g0152941 [Helianthus annuus]|nr:hypothetical protein HanRHA438_Chr04g0152941 [Helianthus annuus]
MLKSEDFTYIRTQWRRLEGGGGGTGYPMNFSFSSVMYIAFVYKFLGIYTTPVGNLKLCHCTYMHVLYM